MDDLDRVELLLGSENDTAIDMAMAWLHRGEDVAHASLTAAERDRLLAADLGHAGAAGHLADEGADTSGWSGEALLALAGYYRSIEEPDREEEVSATQRAMEKLEGKAKHEALLSLGRNQRFAGRVRRRDRVLPTGGGARSEWTGPGGDRAHAVLRRPQSRSGSGRSGNRRHRRGAVRGTSNARRAHGRGRALRRRDRRARPRAGACAHLCGCVTQLLRGRVLLSLGREAQARLRKSIDLYDRAVSLGHGSPYAHYNRGLAHQTAGRWREAVENFERALAYTDPSKRQDAVA